MSRVFPSRRIRPWRLLMPSACALCLCLSLLAAALWPTRAWALDASVRYVTHVQNIGWQGNTRDARSWATDGATAGTTGRSLRLEGLMMEVSAPEDVSGGIEYCTHVQNIGWQGWVSDGELAGTTGRSLRLEAVCIRLTGQLAERYDVYYRVHAQNIGWMDWASNGNPAGTSGLSYRLEGLQVVLVAKGGAAPGSTKTPYSSLHYCTHVQNVGWQAWAHSGATSGTTGRSLRLEGIRIALGDQFEAGGSLRYCTHVQNIGWQGWVSDGELSGTTGRSLRLEAIKIELTGELVDTYDVYYRVHAQNFGWMGWAKNGEAAGTAGYSYRLEGIQIQVLPKGSAPAGYDASAEAFSEKPTYHFTSWNTPTGTAHLAARVAGGATPGTALYSSGSQWTAPTQPALQEYRAIMDAVTSVRGDDIDNTSAYASCHQASGAIIRATVDPDFNMTGMTGGLQYVRSSSKWTYVGSNLSVSQMQAGDVMIDDGNHTCIYIPNDIVRQYWPNSHGNIYEGSWSRKMYPYITYYGSASGYTVWRCTTVQRTVREFIDVDAVLASAK